MRSNRNDDDSSSDKLIPILLILIGIGMVYWLLFSDGSGDLSLSSVSRKNPLVEERVNSHLEKTIDRIEMKKKQAVIEGTRKALDFHKSKPMQPIQIKNEGVDLRQDRRTERVVEDLGRDQRIGPRANNPTELVHSQLLAEDLQRQEDEAYRKEYARQYVENAKKAGWVVELDDNYTVISVKKASDRDGSTSRQGYKLFDSDISSGGF